MGNGDLRGATEGHATSRGLEWGSQTLTLWQLRTPIRWQGTGTDGSHPGHRRSKTKQHMDTHVGKTKPFPEAHTGLPCALDWALSKTRNPPRPVPALKRDGDTGPL